MKQLIIIAPLILTGCFAHFSGNSQTGQYSATFIGSDVKDYIQNPSEVRAATVSSSDGFREINKTARMGIGARAAIDLSKTAYSAAFP